MLIDETAPSSDRERIEHLFDRFNGKNLGSALDFSEPNEFSGLISDLKKKVLVPSKYDDGISKMIERGLKLTSVKD